MKEQGAKIQSVDRAFKILELFTGSISEIGITEISSYMGLSKSTIHGLVQTLLVAGYLEQNVENKKYRLGIKLFQLGCLVKDRIDLREIAKPFLRQLADTFEMTIHLGIYRDQQVVYIDKVDGKHTRIMYSQVGKNAPLHCTGIGKAVLASLPEKEQTYLLLSEREMLTPNTITLKEALITELAEIKQRGYAMDREEVELGLSCIAVPIYDHQKVAVGAISISGSTQVFTSDRITAIANELNWASHGISSKLGYISTP
jgi:DNA-binding IclR family transcriptional regulator